MHFFHKKQMNLIQTSLLYLLPVPVLEETIPCVIAGQSNPEGP